MLILGQVRLGSEWFKSLTMFGKSPAGAKIGIQNTSPFISLFLR